MRIENKEWKTKPTDRFILKWIKVHLSSRITPGLLKYGWLRPWMLTLLSSAVGTFAGIVFALGSGWLAGCLAAVAQILDGVDGQYARLTDRQSPEGAFWDSVLDRYFDGAMVIGAVIYLVRLPLNVPLWLLLVLGSLAIIGSNLVSYSSSRAENLGIDMGSPTLASKGTRTTAMILCAWGSLFRPDLPFVAICYLALHANLVVFGRLIKTSHAGRGEEND
jgi:phosphatidylglycerophosphate synthase